MMIGNNLFDEKFEEYKLKVKDILSITKRFTEKFNDNAVNKRVTELERKLDEPLLFVVVGEVKAGKSSFVNALLGEDICKTAATPCTDVIQEIAFGDKYSENTISQFRKKVTVSADIIKKITIVDTPGTNSVVKHHQEITEQYIPFSDVVLVVISAKNPYTKTVWDFLDYIKDDWKKKIIFVMQQCDLLSESELVQNLEYVKSHAMGKGFTEISIFPVSAKNEKEGRVEESGFSYIRTYLKNMVTSGCESHYKVISQIETIITIVNELDKRLAERKRILEDLKQLQVYIKKRLERRKIDADNSLNFLTSQISSEYENMCFSVQRKVSELQNTSINRKLLRSSIEYEYFLRETNKDFNDKLFKIIEGNYTREAVKNYITIQSQAVTDIFDKADKSNIKIEKKRIMRRIEEQLDEINSKVVQAAHSKITQNPAVVDFCMTYLGKFKKVFRNLSLIKFTLSALLITGYIVYLFFPVISLVWLYLSGKEVSSDEIIKSLNVFEGNDWKVIIMKLIIPIIIPITINFIGEKFLLPLFFDPKLKKNILAMTEGLKALLIGEQKNFTGYIKSSIDNFSGIIDSDIEGIERTVNDNILIEEDYLNPKLKEEAEILNRTDKLKNDIDSHATSLKEAFNL